MDRIVWRLPCTKSWRPFSFISYYTIFYIVKLQSKAGTGVNVIILVLFSLQLKTIIEKVLRSLMNLSLALQNYPWPQVVIKKIKFGDKPETKIFPKVNSYDPRAPHQQEIDHDGLEHKLQSCSSHSSFFLCHDNIKMYTNLWGDQMNRNRWCSWDQYQWKREIHLMNFMTFPQMYLKKCWHVFKIFQKLSILSAFRNSSLR